MHYTIEMLKMLTVSIYIASYSFHNMISLSLIYCILITMTKKRWAEIVISTHWWWLFLLLKGNGNTAQNSNPDLMFPNVVTILLSYPAPTIFTQNKRTITLKELEAICPSKIQTEHMLNSTHETSTRFFAWRNLQRSTHVKKASPGALENKRQEPHLIYFIHALY